MLRGDDAGGSAELVSGPLGRVLALAVSTAAASGCAAPWPAQGCEQFEDAYATRLVECGVFPRYDQALAAVVRATTGRNPAGCGAVHDIVEPSLWFEECIPQIRERSCDEILELPNPCRGQLVFRE